MHLRHTVPMSFSASLSGGNWLRARHDALYRSRLQST